jgi:cobalamin synthase
MMPAAALSQRTPAVLLAARVLFPFDMRAGEDAPGWRRAGLWFVLWGLVIGLVYATVFRGTWRWFGHYQYVRFVPVACVLAVDLGWCGYRLIASAAAIAGRSELDSGGKNAMTLPAVLVVILVAILKYAMLLSLPIGGPTPMGPADWGGWRSHLGLLYPQPIYRPLILMPLWGRWAMMLALAIGRAAPTASERLKLMAFRPGLPSIMAAWLACTLLTVAYLAASPSQVGQGVVLALGMLVAAYLASFILARSNGGQTEATVGTAGLAAEMAFLALYLPIARLIFWY